MPPSVTSHAAIKEAPPDIDVPSVADAVKRQFGLEGAYSPLISERDQNFHLQATEGGQYVVKVTSATETPITSAFQIGALLHLEGSAAVRVPKVIRTTDGQAMGRIVAANRSFALRVLSYLEGTQLASIEISADIAQTFGAGLANLDVALQGYSHDGENPILLWDLQRAAELQDLLHHIAEQSLRERVDNAVDDFKRLVLPKLGSLRAQVIHGDANPENVLVDPVTRSLSGFIDFSDLVKAPMVIDVAIAAAYLRADGNDVLELIAAFVRGYNAVLPLRHDELALLFDLVRARLATSITMLHWRLGARDENDPYRRKSLELEADAIGFLSALDTLGKAGFQERLGR